MDMQTVAEVKQIASQLGQPGSPGVQVHNRIGIEVSIDCTTEISIKYYHIVVG